MKNYESVTFIALGKPAVCIHICVCVWYISEMFLTSMGICILV